MCAKSVRKRDYPRRNASVVVKIPYCDSFCFGLATNLSEKGMRIQSGTCLPCNTEGNLLIPIKNKEIELSMRVRWIDEGSGFYDAMGVEILKTPEQYRQLVKNLPS